MILIHSFLVRHKPPNRQPRIQNPSLMFRWHWLPWWILDTTMQCHCHNWQDPNSPKTMSPKMYSISAFYLDFFKYLILYHIMLRSHSLKEKYVYIWKFSTVIWRRLTLLNMFLDGITHHSSSFISFFLINFVIIQACISIIPSFLAPSPSDEVHTSRDTFITTRVWNQKLWILLAAAVF